MYWKYFKYVLRHKWFVFLECYKMNQIWRGITHDLSKFRLDEFIPYARYFYGKYPDIVDVLDKPQYNLNFTFTKQMVQRRFDVAWLKHQHRNPHHWQHWILQEDDGDCKYLIMHHKYYKEMLADWKGAGRAITGSKDPNECKNWYLKNRDKIKVHSAVRTWIEMSLKIKS